MVPESHEVTRANARGQGRPGDPRDGLAGLSCFTLSLHCKGADSCTGSLVRGAGDVASAGRARASEPLSRRYARPLETSA